MKTLDIPARKEHLRKVVTKIEASHYNFDVANNTESLTVISHLTTGLCEHIGTLTNSRMDTTTAAIAHIETKEVASSLTYLCLKELQSTHRRDTIVAVTEHTALSNDTRDTLGRMDLHIDAARRIRHLIVPLGDLAAYWNAQPDQPDAYCSREYAITSIAYRAACTLIAADRHLIAHQ